MTHRHFRVNGRIVNIPSYVVRAGDVISIAPGSLKSPVFASNLEVAQSRRPPDWLEWNDQEKTAKVLEAPPREQIDTPVDEQLIVEYYSR